MHKNNLDEALADKVMGILAERKPEDVLLRELTECVQADIASKGRWVDGEPTTGAVLEERINLKCLSTRQKLDQCRNIIEFFRYAMALLHGVPAKMPDILVKASRVSPESADALFGPHIAKLN